MPLQRRIELLRSEPGFHAHNHSPSVRAVKLLDRWRLRLREPGEAGFQRLLDAYSIDESQLIMAIDAAATGSLRCGLQELFPEHDAPAAPFTWQFDSPFVQVCNPLIEPFIGKLNAIVTGLCSTHPQILGDDPESLMRLLLAPLGAKLHRLVRKTCVLELNVMRILEKLKGGTPEERFQDFVRHLGTPSYQRQFLSEYAVIAFHAITMARQWQRNMERFVARLTADHDLYSRELLGGGSCGPLTSVSWNAGDSHQDGQSVCIVEWLGGQKLVYKPHTLDIDLAFGKLIDRLNAAPLQPGLRHPAALDLGDHGWVEFMPHQECHDESGIRDFYWRQGVYLSVFHVLGTQDLHYENLIACGDCPVYVDCETITCPPLNWVVGQDLPLSLLPPLVSSLDILPHRVWGKKAGEGIDISGLGGAPGQVLPNSVIAAADAWTDTMHVVEGDLVTQASAHLPSLQGKWADGETHLGLLVEGFHDGYRSMLENGIREATAWFEDVRVRLVKRPTNLYARLLDTGYHPDYLRDGLDHEAFISGSLAMDEAIKPGQLRAELLDMAVDDIPYFSVRFNSRSILDSRDHEVDRMPGTTAQAVARNAASLSARDLRQQLQLLRGRLGVLPDRPAEPVQITGGAMMRMGTAAMAIQRQTLGIMLADAIRSDGRRLWVIPDVPPTNEPIMMFDNVPGNIYRGGAGIALYFLELHARTGKRRHKILFENCLQNVLDWRASVSDLHMDCGLFEGRAGLELFVIKAGQHLQDQRLVESGLKGLLRIGSRLAKTEAWDVLSGIAGYILALNDAQRLLDEWDLTTMMRAAGHELLRRGVETDRGMAWLDKTLSDRPLAGFAHGASGAAAALAVAGAHCGHDEFLKAAWSAVAYEDSLYDPTEGNWTDERTMLKLSDAGTGASLNAWCHGAAGIGLARTYLLPVAQTSAEDIVLNRDFERVRRSEYSGLNSDCLCHGQIGNLLCMLHVADAIDDSAWRNSLRHQAVSTLDAISQRAPVTGLGDELHRKLYPQNPGLMCGLAGIGLGALYLVDDDLHGSILSGRMLTGRSLPIQGAMRFADSRPVVPVSGPGCSKTPVFHMENDNDES